MQEAVGVLKTHCLKDSPTPFEMQDVSLTISVLNDCISKIKEKMPSIKAKQ